MDTISKLKYTYPLKDIGNRQIEALTITVKIFNVNVQPNIHILPSENNSAPSQNKLIPTDEATTASPRVRRSEERLSAPVPRVNIPQEEIIHTEKVHSPSQQAHIIAND